MRTNNDLNEFLDRVANKFNKKSNLNSCNTLNFNCDKYNWFFNCRRLNMSAKIEGIIH